MSHFFFSFYPSHERYPKQGRATHYCRNNGIITLDEDIAQYIASCIRYGKRPALFAQGWLNRRNNTFNVGFEIPRDSMVPTLVEQAQRIAQINLATLFDQEN